MEYKEVQFDWIDMAYYLKKRLLIIIAAGLVCALAGFLFTVLFVKPQYTASTRIYVLNRASENSVSYSDYYSTNYMVKDYEVLITGRNVTRKVVEQLNLNMSPSALSRRISVSAVKETRVLQIQVVDTNPRRAADIANCVREVASQQIKQILNVEAVNLVYEAEVPGARSGPSLVKNVVWTTVIGLFITICILILTFSFDDTIRTEDDVEHFLGLSVLGVIPVSSEMAMMSVATPEKARSTAERAQQKSVRKKKA